MQKSNATVIDTLTYIMSTAWSGEYIIMGTSLHELMQEVITDLKDNSKIMFDLDHVFLHTDESEYTNQFYLDFWYKCGRPIAEKFIKRKYPAAWFLKLYSTKKFDA